MTRRFGWNIVAVLWAVTVACGGGVGWGYVAIRAATSEAARGSAAELIGMCALIGAPTTALAVLCTVIMAAGARHVRAFR